MMMNSFIAMNEFSWRMNILKQCGRHRKIRKMVRRSFYDDEDEDARGTDK